ncbi:MAG: outer membrane beta-barrel family protein [Cyclobacteriaceae bacterium]
MKKKCLLLVCFAFAFTGILLGQKLATVSGRIVDKDTGEPLPFTSVLLGSASDGSHLGGAIANEEGRFTISGVERGEYELTFTFVGYETAKQPLLIGELNNFFDIGSIGLIASGQELEEVVVEANKEMLSSGMDAKTFDMDENVAQSGGTVLDVMKTMPGVTVSQEGKIILRGSDKVAVLIDGKQSSLTGFGNQKSLDNIPAANIERIEIINNPSSKYDASGLAGIVNIIYKKEKESGLNGDVGMAYGIGALSKQRPDNPTDLGSYSGNSKLIPSLNFNYKTPKVNYFLQSQVIFQKHLPNNEFTFRKYNDGRVTASQVPENRTQTHYIINGGMDWSLGEKDVLTFSGIYDYEVHTDTSQVAYINQLNNRRYRYWAWNEEEVTGYMNYLLNLKHQFEQPGHELDASLQYTKGWEDETYSLNDSSEVRIGKDLTHIIATEHTATFGVDYTKPLRRGRLESGTKLRFRRLPVEYLIEPGDQSIIYPDLGDWSKWGENLYAVYINYILERHDFDIEGGIRAEHTDVFYNLSSENGYYPNDDAYDYFKLFPNVRLTLKLDNTNRVSAFYNRRVDRPGEPELRVFPKYDDPELLKVGNPYLRPQFTESFELAYKYIWTTGSVYLAGFRRIITDPFMRIYGIDSNSSEYDIINKIYQNTGRATNTGVELLLTQDIADIGKLSGSFNWYQNEIEAYQGTMLFPYVRPYTLEASDDNTWDFKVNGLFFLSGSVQAQITTLYYAPKNIPQGRQLSRSSVDLGLKKTFERGEVSFSVSDVFQNFGIRQDLQGSDFSARYENNYETQVLRIGFKYKI